MLSRHRGQLSVAVEAVVNSSRSDLVFTNALLSCVPWSSRDCSEQLDWFSHLRFRVANCPRSDVYRLHSSTSQSAHPGISSSLQSNTCDTSCCILATEAKSFNSLDNFRAITPDALLTESSTPEPATACNSLSLCHRREVVKEIDRRSAVILTDT